MGKDHKRAGRGSQQPAVEQFVKKPLGLVRCGKFLSPSARAVYDVIASFDPSYPGYRTIQSWTGLGSEAVSRALDELTTKKIVERESGSVKRVNNQYLLLPQSEWMLTAEFVSAHRRRKREAASKSEAGCSESEVGAGSCFENRSRAASKIEDGSTSKIEEELDQSDPDQLIRGAAPRQRCPDGQDQIPPGPPSGGGEGVAPAGDGLTSWSEEWRRAAEEPKPAPSERRPHESQLKELRKAFAAGKISKKDFVAKVEELAALDGAPTYFVKSSSKPRPQKAGGRGAKSKFHASANFPVRR